jgi:hypothetical protein
MTFSNAEPYLSSFVEKWHSNGEKMCISNYFPPLFRLIYPNFPKIRVTSNLLNKISLLCFLIESIHVFLHFSKIFFLYKIAF